MPRNMKKREGGNQPRLLVVNYYWVLLFGLFILIVRSEHLRLAEGSTREAEKVRVSLCNSDCPGTLCLVDRTGL